MFMYINEGNKKFYFAEMGVREREWVQVIPFLSNTCAASQRHHSGRVSDANKACHFQNQLKHYFRNNFYTYKKQHACMHFELKLRY